MNIPELKWVMQNRSLLSKEDYAELESYDLFKQYDDNKELHYNGEDMLKVIRAIIDIHEKYNAAN